MATRRVWSGGDNSTPTVSWAGAHTTIAAAITASTAGDTFWIASDHTENFTVATTFAFKGTPTASDIILSVQRSDDTLVKGASFTTSTNDDTITVNGTLFMWGVILDAGNTSSGASALFFNRSAGHKQLYENCDLKARNTGSVSFQIGFDQDATSGSLTLFRDCGWLDTGNAAKMMRLSGTVRIEGGSLLTGYNANTFISPLDSKMGGDILITGLDMVNAPAGIDIFNGTNFSRAATRLEVRNCKLPASWTGTLFATTPSVPDIRASMLNCDSGDTNYKLWVEDMYGSVRQETVITRTGGATDGDTGLSLKMVSHASNALFPLNLCASHEISRRYPGTSAEDSAWSSGAAKTVGLEIVHDSQGAGTGADFQNDEIWLEVEVLDVSGFPLSHIVSSRRGLRSSAADIANSSETWTTTGLTTPVKQTLSVSVNPREKGSLRLRVFIAKANKTVYVCPKVEVS